MSIPRLTRFSRDKAYLYMASALSQRSTCLDKQVGCIITNRNNEIIGSGYNGAPRGLQHCIDLGYCIKDRSNNAANCPSAHAEQNALLQCRVPEQIHTVYLTLSPCISCVRILLNTPCTKIVFINAHKHKEPKSLWNREWQQHGIENFI